MKLGNGLHVGNISVEKWPMPGLFPFCIRRGHAVMNWCFGMMGLRIYTRTGSDTDARTLHTVHLGFINTGDDCMIK